MDCFNGVAYCKGVKLYLYMMPYFVVQNNIKRKKKYNWILCITVPSISIKNKPFHLNNNKKLSSKFIVQIIRCSNITTPTATLRCLLTAQHIIGR
jgi:hypothetical protein